MKFNYFKILEDKYKTRLSVKSPIVIRLDGKNICKNKEINMLDENKNGFAFALKQTASFFSRKLSCIALASSDEINLLILDPSLLKRIYKSLECQKVSSLIAQDVAFEFNSNYDGERILFDARTFNIPSHKINSYTAYRTQSAKNVYTIYYAKKLLSGYERKGKKVCEIEDILCDISDDFKYRSIHNTLGTAYIDGYEIDIMEVLSSYNTPKDLLKLTHEQSKNIIIDSADDSTDLEDDLFA